MKKTFKSKLPNKIVTKLAYSAVRLKEKINIKTKTIKEHRHDMAYYVEFPEGYCNEN